jgi:hypothetical protein
MNGERFCDRIDVHTVFNATGRKITPVRFRWNGRVYSIAEITYTWESTHGATTFLHFAARGNADLFELVLDTKRFIWELRNVESLAE